MPASKDSVASILVRYVREHGRVPRKRDFTKLLLSAGEHPREYLYQHSSYEAFAASVIDSEPGLGVILTPQKLNRYASNSYRQELQDAVRRSPSVLITGAVLGHPADRNFFRSMLRYAELHRSVVLLVPLVESGSVHAAVQPLDPELWSAVRSNKARLLIGDLQLHRKLRISSRFMSAASANPLSAARTESVKTESSVIVASPHQHLDTLSAGPNTENLATLLLSTGAVTHPGYETSNLLNAARSLSLADDHTVGALVVDLDEGLFHVRQIQAATDGSFFDVAARYSPTKITAESPAAAVFGDVHFGFGATDEECYRTSLDMLETTQPKRLYLHDTFDGQSVNHHENASPVVSSIKSRLGLNDVEREIELTARALEDVSSRVRGSVYVVDSNHDDFLKRCLQTGNTMGYDANTRRYLERLRLDWEEAAEAAGRRSFTGIREVSPFLMALSDKWETRQPKNLKFLGLPAFGKPLEDGAVCEGIMMAEHGHQGPNGSRGSVRSLAGSYGRCIIGHNHGAKIYRQIFQVGTNTRLYLGYNNGPSGWMQTNALVAQGGAVQLIHNIMGRWCSRRTKLVLKKIRQGAKGGKKKGLAPRRRRARR